jgi:surfeit locus 1 family protein
LRNLHWYLLAVALSAGFIALGFWQLDRARYKEQLLAALAAAQDAPVQALSESLSQYPRPPDSGGESIVPRRVSGHGHYDDSVTVLLDNQVLDGRVGIMVLTLFRPEDSRQVVLVNRGWLPLPPDRRVPQIAPAGDQSLPLSGLLTTAPGHGFRMGNAPFQQGAAPPLLAYLDLAALRREAGVELADAIVQLDPDAPAGFVRHWQAAANPMPPERHRAYAFQWFALALGALLALWLLRKRLA